METLKMMIIGDSGVGKTCLLLRFSDNNFALTHMTTIGVDYKFKQIELEGKEYKLQIWDTAGQERFRTITHTYYKGAHGIILAFAINDRNSFENVENWIQQIEEHAFKGVQKILVGTKCDAPDRAISVEQGQRLADQYEIPYFETSAKNGINVEEAVMGLARKVVDKGVTNEMTEHLKLSYGLQKPTGKKNCCK